MLTLEVAQWQNKTSVSDISYCPLALQINGRNACLASATSQKAVRNNCFQIKTVHSDKLHLSTQPPLFLLICCVHIQVLLWFSLFPLSVSAFWWFIIFPDTHDISSVPHWVASHPDAGHCPQLLHRPILRCKSDTCSQHITALRASSYFYNKCKCNGYRRVLRLPFVVSL